MGLKKNILSIILSFFHFFFKRKKINKHQITFISLESCELTSDFKIIYDHLKSQNHYQLKTALIHFDKNSLINNFKYMLNTIKQLYLIDTSALVILNDNNFVVSQYKRKDVHVLQIWHACGAIKKFGNALVRQYKIQNYDYVISNSDYWQDAYSQAFNVKAHQVITTGMPRVDCLYDQNYLHQAKCKLENKYPELKDKRIILYAPTFRGNIYKGFSSIDLDSQKIIDYLGEDYVFVYKMHPLISKTSNRISQQIYDLSGEETYELFALSDMMISDFSSIIFDYSILKKPMCYYVPDLDEYLDTVGCFVDYQCLPGVKCDNIEDLILALQSHETSDLQSFEDTFFQYHDGHNIDRVINLIDQIMKNA